MKKLSILMLAVAILFVGCEDDDGSEPQMLTLEINGLEDLGSDFVYEGWLIVNGSAVTSGIFTVDNNGNMSTNAFSITEDDLANASTFVLTIEPSPDPDPGPSDVHILAGDFNGSNASLTIDHPAALSDNFSSASGGYILATPTDGSDNNENSGIWFLDPTGGSPVAALDLPTLPPGWIYEGWAVIDGNPVTTGTFLSVSGADNTAEFSGPMPGPAYPGEDFLINAPSGLSFPTDLAGGTAVISIEPVPDNSEAPFLLKPLVGGIPANALDHTFYTMETNPVYPTGTARK